MQGEKCTATACGGTIDDTGFCDSCGAAAKSTPSPVPVGPAATGNAASSSLRGSSRSGVQISAQLSRSSNGISRQAAGASTRTSSRGRIGLGLVTVPPVVPVALEKAVMANPVVPEHRRICPTCEGQGVRTLCKREEGYCSKCGQPFSFKAKLTAGEVVAEQYEIKGPIAFGGMGWIYAAWDKKVGRPVVLKGLLNSTDAALAAAAEQERRMLAKIKHGNIVGIYNFVTVGTNQYIVMEYVGGKTLKALRKERGPLPPAEAIAYVHRMCSAFTFLHAMTPQILVNDFKPDNAMLEDDDVKMIDLGALLEADDTTSDVYGTEGYSAPEAGQEPSVRSDIYTLARTLMVLILGDSAKKELMFNGFDKEYRFALPPQDQYAVLAENDSLYRFLLKAIRQNPDDRFQTVEEFAVQLEGVLHEIVSRQTGTPQPDTSKLFGADPLALTTTADMEDVGADWHQLPAAAVDPLDEAANVLLRMGNLPAAIRLQGIAAARENMPSSRELSLRQAEALMELGQLADALNVLAQCKTADPWDWRVDWLFGRCYLAQGQAQKAKSHFDSVYCDLPGELDAKFGVALAAELLGDLSTAAVMYGIVTSTDPNRVSAAFGLARTRAAQALVDQATRGNLRTQAIAALDSVPPGSTLYVVAQMMAARTLVRSDLRPSSDEFQAASAKVKALTLDGVARFRLVRDLFQRALDELSSGRLHPNGNSLVLDQPLDDTSLRLGLEAALRQLARLAEGDERIALIDQANAVRPLTTF